MATATSEPTGTSKPFSPVSPEPAALLVGLRTSTATATPEPTPISRHSSACSPAGPARALQPDRPRSCIMLSPTRRPAMTRITRLVLVLVAALCLFPLAACEEKITQENFDKIKVGMQIYEVE